LRKTKNTFVIFNLYNQFNIKLLIAFVVFCIFIIGTYKNVNASKNDSLQLNETKWKRISENVDYSENYLESSNKSQKANKNYSFNWLKSDLIQNIFTIVILGLLVFLLFKIIKHSIFSLNKKIGQNNTYQVLNENTAINDLDLQEILKEVLSENNYKLAIRIRFLMILKFLLEKEYIKWEIDKTNIDYLNEMQNKREYADFEYLVLIYERIWFSDVDVNLNDFNILNVYFSNFISKPIIYE
jgi:hypothetical protein